MKKLLTLALVLMMVLSLFACNIGEEPSGSDTGTQTDPPSSQGGNSETTSGNNEADLTTVDGWLTYWGLTENDLKCANFTRLDMTSRKKDTLEITSVGAYCDTKLTENDVRAWLEQILAKLNTMSAEGKVVNKLDNNAELTADYIIAKGKSYLYTISGYFTYNGKNTSVFLTVEPGQLDNTDPNEAMAACMIELRHR